MSSSQSDPLRSHGDGITLAKETNQDFLYEYLYKGNKDKFWPYVQPNPANWNKYCPYQLIVVKKNRTGQYEAVPSGTFTFPLPPEALSESTPFAITSTPQLEGFYEEHAGVVYKTYQIRGTTGVLPGKDSGISKEKMGAVKNLESIFAGTVQQGRSIGNNAAQALGSITGQYPPAFNVHTKKESEDRYERLGGSTGFWQINLLSQFLEAYVNAKKLKEFSDYRLAFAIWKRNSVVLVRPISFDIVQDAGSPLEYRYSLTLQGSKRILLQAGTSTITVEPPPIRQDQNLIAKALSTLIFARKTVQGAGAMKQAVLGDIDYVLSPINNTILLGKDMIGATLQLADMPLAIKQRISLDLNQAKESLVSLGEDSKALGSLFSEKGGLVSNIINLINSNIHTLRRSNAISSLQVLLDKIPLPLAEKIPLTSIPLPQDVKSDIQSMLQRVKNLTRKDFEDYATRLKDFYNRFATLVGAGDPTVNDMLGLNITPIKDQPTSADWDVLNSLDDAISTIEQFAGTAKGEPTQAPTWLDRFGGLSVASGIAWVKPVAKFAIPVPYGATLEETSDQYLGTPDRVNEIIALNGLKSPYIDELGYSLNLRSNGIKNMVTVETNNDLFVGKTVWIWSKTVAKETRTIEEIVVQGSISYLKLSGEDDLDKLKVSEAAKIDTFLSGTTNSQNMLWIPSDREPVGEEDVVTKSIFGVDATDPWFGVGGLDLLMDSNNDLVIGEDGDFRFTYGMANLIQWLRAALSIEQGELIEHRDFGLPLSVGMSTADFNPQKVLEAVRKMLANDNTFSRIDKLQIRQDGPTVKIDISAAVTGISQPVPLTFEMKLG